jgi:DNA-binding MarR family transcriptional regulator
MTTKIRGTDLPTVLPVMIILKLIQQETGPSFQISQLNLMLTIMDEDGIPYPEIMLRTGLPASTISRNVKDLFKRGLVEIIVDPVDTRCHAARLTKKGGDLKREIQRILKGGFVAF